MIDKPRDSNQAAPNTQIPVNTPELKSMSNKKRVDVLLYERGFAPSRERAQAFIMAGKVIIYEQKIEKPGQKVFDDCDIRVIGEDQPFVSRGGLKLEQAIKSFGIDVSNTVVMDIGASTGGFTDCLLSCGASFVFAVDSGVNQLAWKLVNDKRVKNLEKTNFRYLTMEDVGTFLDLVVIDVSFISLEKILPNCWNFLKKNGNLVALVKPQFEAGRDNIKKGGIVDDPKVHNQVIDTLKMFSTDIGFKVLDLVPSPIQGKKSHNKEFLLHLLKP